MQQSPFPFRTKTSEYEKRELSKTSDAAKPQFPPVSCIKDNGESTSPGFTRSSSKDKHKLGARLTPRLMRRTLTSPRVHFAQRYNPAVPLSPLATSKSDPFRSTCPSRKSRKSLPPSSKLAKTRLVKRAVLVGTNYASTKEVQTLSGCEKDVSMLFDLLTSELGFSANDIWVLTDEPRAAIGAVCRYMPTRANLLNSMKWLVQNGNRGDQLVFLFSGHGQKHIQGLSKKRLEYDCIVPSDYPVSDPISAEEIHNILVQGLADGATLTSLVDCPYAGSIMRLPFLHAPVETRKGLFTLREVLQEPDGGTIPTDDSGMNLLHHLNRPYKQKLEIRRKIAHERRERRALSCFQNGKVICIAVGREVENPSGSKTSIYRNMSSALTFAFVRYMRHCVSQNEKASYGSVLSAMSMWLTARGHVLPQVSSSHSLSPDSIVALLQELDSNHR